MTVYGVHCVPGSAWKPLGRELSDALIVNRTAILQQSRPLLLHGTTAQGFREKATRKNDEGREIKQEGSNE